MPDMLEAQDAVAAASRSRGVRLSEVGDLGKLDLRGDPNDKAFMSSVGRTLDLILPMEPCQSAAQGEIAALWIGPDQWLITCPKARIAAIAEELDEAIRDLHGSVTDMSAGRIVFRLEGPSAQDVIAKGCPIDLHPRVAAPGYVAGSALAKIGVLIHLRDADVIDIYLSRSYCDYLWAWLEEAGLDCGLIVG
jgi:sarcosine oxidase subunit gamma